MNKYLIPDTIGEMIAFLKKFPENWQLSVFTEEKYCDTPKYKMSVETFDSLGTVNLTLM